MSWSNSRGRGRSADKERSTALRSSLIVLAAAAALLWGPAAVEGQMMTEQFIPIGQSPGLSSTHTDIGEIETVDPAARRITLGGRSIAVTARTRIWLDRSALRQANVTGGFADLRQGRRAEVKYEDAARRVSAEWIKVAPEPGG
ncbi:MAG: hypothetical protein OEU09_07435 [Rhodospirillales bacterium]|nr:hypothetical protein [Rhodospirillales bacterium]MDH3792865.1 hypothetical protein [Rhodospirillales bacterium]MDH3911114.1 hypothetical protein [Rhodospirillales bacterium]MDH3920339.1 hypothetical protein [Rhodospirillales bacterium]MDH3967350.1 hypothetical protein [Rhodospirillales bacterium]